MTESRLTPVAIKAPHGARELTITWADGQSSIIPHEILRGYCPCAGCQGHAGSIRFVAGGDLELVELSQVGNYALGLKWGDGHDSGIFSFKYLRALAELLSQQGAEGLKRLAELPRI